MISQDFEFSLFRFHLDCIHRDERVFSVSQPTSGCLLNSVLNLFYMAVDYKYAYNQCCFPACRHFFELLGRFLSFLFTSVYFTSHLISNFHLHLFFLSRGSLGFELRTFSCGQPFMSFSNGSSMPASRFGIFYFYFFEVKAL